MKEKYYPYFYGLAIIICMTAIMLCGCQSLGLATPKGLDQQIGQAYGVYTAVNNATATATQSGAITGAEAEAVQSQARSARALLDAARSAELAGNTTGANNNLTLALSALTALQTYLNSQVKK